MVVSYAYNQFWMNVEEKTPVIFQVTTCADAGIALSSTLGERAYHTYELVLGTTQNSRSILRNRTTGEVYADVQTPSLLSCTDARPFWLRFEKGIFEVGRGHDVGSDIFLSYVDTTPTAIHALGTTTISSPSTYWQFLSYIG